MSKWLAVANQAVTPRAHDQLEKPEGYLWRSKRDYKEQGLTNKGIWSVIELGLDCEELLHDIEISLENYNVVRSVQLIGDLQTKIMEIARKCVRAVRRHGNNDKKVFIEDEGEEKELEEVVVKDLRTYFERFDDNLRDINNVEPERTIKTLLLVHNDLKRIVRSYFLETFYSSSIKEKSSTNFWNTVSSELIDSANLINELKVRRDKSSRSKVPKKSKTKKEKGEDKYE